MADLLLHGKPLLIRDIEPSAPLLYPPILEMARRAGVQSFVAVPLQIHGKILGFLVGDRGLQPCTDDDLQIQLTIGGHVAAAIDNAKAYADLAELTQHLEDRITQRTEELSRANTQLQEHDVVGRRFSPSCHMNCGLRWRCSGVLRTICWTA